MAVPELPEIEHLKRSLEPFLIGAAVKGVRLLRRDIVHPTKSGSPGRGHGRDLLAGATIERLTRRGKNLAIVSDSGRVLLVHLGMSGQLRFVPAHQRLGFTDHVHCTWRIDSPRGPGRLVFRDPRRFGGLWTHASLAELERERWSKLGPDALTIAAADLYARIHQSVRPIKAALLDQSVLAGVGNIYADEALFRAGIHPATSCRHLRQTNVRRLSASIRSVLKAAINSGGSSIRSYIDANGESGWFARRHQVYGRGGQPCRRCRRVLETMIIAQRTTVSCARCQTVID